MNTLESIAAGIGAALEPLTGAFSDPRRAEQLLNALGWQLPPGVTDIGLSKIDVAGLVDKVTDLRAAGKFEGSASGVSIGLSADLLVTVQAFLRDLNGFAKGLSAILSGDYLTRTRIREEFPRRLLDYLFIQQLRISAGPILTTFSMSGVVRFEVHAEDPLNFGSAHVRHIVAYDRIGPLLTDAGGQIRQFFDWGTPQFDSGKVLLLAGFFLQAIGGRVKFRPLAREVEERLSGVSVPEADTAPLSHMVVSFKAKSILDDSDIGLIALGLRPSAPGGSNGGFAFSAFVRGTADRALSMRENLTLELDSTLDLAEGAVASVRPGHPLQIQTGVSGKNSIANAAQGRMAFRTRYPGPSASPVTLFAMPGGTSLKANEITFAFGVDTKSAGPSPFIEVGLHRVHLHLSGLGSDGFLASVLPLNLDADFDLLTGWNGEGLYFQGSSALQVQLASHISIGPIEILALGLGVGFDGAQVAAKIASSIKGSLGPLTALIEGLGVEARIRLLGDNSGNLGPIDLVPGLSLPDGVGLSLDAGVISGGGFLFFDSAHGEYAGALELTLLEIISIRAIGIITTKMPDGSKGFSLLIIMSVEFPGGIQLGFGFTLLAVGGLVGLNRTMNLQALTEGVRTGGINSVMFPRDIIANAPKIISDLRAFFPPQEGTFLIGPMVKLGWGTPTLVSVALGIIIEIPGNIAILGVLRVAIPAEDIAIIKIQVQFVGAIEFDKQRLFFFASLFESRIAFLTLDGEMGLLVAWGDDANFVLSVGGFHPQFSPPPLPFPSPKRISISLLSTPLSRLRVECYFAVTSNTVQFGARAEVFYGLAILNAQGHLAFDALFQFSPFHFIIEISASFSVNAFGFGLFSVGIGGSLEGPEPWHIKGHGSISLLFWDINVDFETTWGDSQNTMLPPIVVLPLLQAELNKADTWRALLPASANLFVTLRKLPSAEAALIMHPVGVLHISQRAVPLEITLDKVGNQKPSDVTRLSVAVTSGGLAKTGDAFEQFAPAQFQNLSDADKLSRPAFAPERSGLDLSAAGADVRSSVMIKRIARYEQIVIDSNFKRFSRMFSAYVASLFNFFLNGNAAARSSVSPASKAKLQPFSEKIDVAAETYTVAFQATNKPFASETTSFHSEASAREYLSQKVAEDGRLADVIHVIPGYEKAA